MTKKSPDSILLNLLVLVIAITFFGFSTPTQALDIYAGHFNREGNNQTPSATSKNNIYIKLYKDQWVSMLYIPYPYAKTVSDQAISRVFEASKAQTGGSAYLRGKFDHLEQLATVQIEKFGFLDDVLVFECGALSPCTIKVHDDFIELIKPGVINEHIIKYNHVID